MGFTICNLCFMMVLMKIKICNLKVLKFLFLLLPVVFLFIPFKQALSQSTQTAQTTVSIPPRESDLPISISSDNTSSNIPQNTTITYTITYGLNTSVSFPLTITASWAQGTIQGNPSPSVDIVGYVIGSATNGYSSTHRTVDLVNNKITWVYTSFPAVTTGQTVTFKLKTNSSYTGALPVSFNISTNSKSNPTTTSNQTLTQTYKYSSPPTPTATPTPVSNTSSTTSTPIPAPIPLPTFTDIQIRTISQNGANILVSTSTKTKLTVSYGNSLGLNNILSFSDYSSSRLINLKDLLPNTQYFFKLVAQDSFRKSINSDTFTFITAKISTPVSVNQNSIVIVSGGNVVFDTSTKAASPSASTGSQNFIVIPKASGFQFKFSLQNKKSVKKVRLILRRITGRNVLGANTLVSTAEANTASVTVIEITSGVYSAVVDTNQEFGLYRLVASFIDENGNLIEEDLGNIKIGNPFTVLDKNENPIEGARIFLYVYDENEKKFVPLSPTFININNPSFTNNIGVANFVLPKGKYRTQILNLGYKEKIVNFTIGDDPTNGYPIVYLDKTNLNILEFINFYWHTFNEVFLSNTYTYVASLQNSIRFFDLVTGLTLLLFVVITLFAFSKKHHIPLSSFVSYFFYLLNHRERNKKYINGVVFDQFQKPIPMANVYLTDSDSEQIVQSAKTNGKGEFFFKKGTGKYLLMIMKKGYQPTPQMPYEEKSDVSYRITMEQKNLKTNILDTISHTFFALIGISSEAFMLLSLIFEILFIPSFGVVKTLPFICVSVFNLLLWILHQRKHYLT